jgi:hypothetical protein
MAATFMPGLELARLFYAEQVRPLLDEKFAGLRHSAALIGPGSEVLGFDSPRSTDHDWGPRLQIFLADIVAGTEIAAGIRAALADRLPKDFRGHPTVFAASGEQAESASHRVEVVALGSWLTGHLGFDPRAGAGLLDWLAAPTQVLAEMTGGAVFHDGLADSDRGGLQAARAALAWYPHDVWLFILACQWQRIDQEEPFPGRCAEAGDDLGSVLVAARIVRDLVRLMLLMQRRYPPYSKWLGTALARTAAGPALMPHLAAVLAATSWPEREDCLSACYAAAARMHNELALTEYVDPAVRPSYYERPYRVLGAARFSRALRDAIADEELRVLPPTGAVDQFIDSTDAIGDQRILRTATAALLAAGHT